MEAPPDPLGAARRGRRPGGPGRERLQLLGLLILAAFLRLAFLAQLRPGDFLRGGDGAYYLHQAWLIAHHALPHPLTTAGPAYPLFLAFVWSFFPGSPEPLGIGIVPGAALLLARLVQIGLSLLVVGWGYRLAREVGGSHRAGMITAIGLGIGPAFVIEPVYILTEPLFIALLTAAVWLYTRAGKAPSTERFALAGLVFGLAALTRPVAMLLPVVLVPHLANVHRAQGWRRYAAALLGAFALTLLPWMIYLARSTGNPLPEGFSSNLWIGAVGDGQWQGTVANYQQRQTFGGEREDYIPEALRIILADPLGWIALRARNFVAAVATPHGTSDLGGPSIKDLFAEWLAQGRSLEGLRSVVGAPNFGMKLVIYAFHAFALAFGAGGAWILRKRWREAYGVVAVIVYLGAAYFPLTVMPRYLFPAEVFVWVLAGVGLTGLWGRRRGDRVPA
jgi:4-amino-4-deoxy-L-arabinose transferase-like glycosyltransferase